MWWRNRNRQIGALVAVLLLIGSLAPLVRANQPSNSYFERTWERTDKPVADGVTPRTWMWGPQGNTGGIPEPYIESPGGMRIVQYFDKSRMEITNPTAVDDGVWFVTNGLLVVEMADEQIQIGHSEWVPHKPADFPVAGDPDDVNGPTYVTLAGLRSWTADRGSAVVIETVNRAGAIGADNNYAAQNVTLAFWDDVTGHNIAKPFWDFMNSTGVVYKDGEYIEDLLFVNPIYATGRPITEPYWANVKVAGTVKSVLMQCFERRCLTYTPDNPVGWQVEAGNVGQHYYCWRYCVDGELPTPVPTNTPPSGGTATATQPGGATATATQPGEATATATQPGGATATATSPGGPTATPTTGGPGTDNPNIDVQEFGIVVDANIQVPGAITGGVATTVGARIFNHANVAEVVSVVTAYTCVLGQTIMIDQGQVTIPANGSVIYQFNWTPPGLGLLCTLELTATTVRTPVDTDSANWAVVLSIGAGGATATPTSSVPTNPNIQVQQFGIVVGGVNIQVPGSLAGGVSATIGARIFNHANVPEAVNVVTTYRCLLDPPVTINQGQITIPANSSAVYQFNWVPPGLGLLCTLELTATTIRTPVDSDDATWAVLITLIGGGTATATPTAVTPTSPNIDVQAFGVVVGVDITVLGNLNAGAVIPLGARIYNFSNVPEEVQVTLDYRFSLLGIVFGQWQTIDAGTIVVPANSSAVFQRNWNPGSTLGTYQIRATATTIRTPVSSDSQYWTAVLVNP